MSHKEEVFKKVTGMIEEAYPFVTIDKCYRDELDGSYGFRGAINLIEGEFELDLREYHIKDDHLLKDIITKNKDVVYKLYDIISDEYLDYTIEIVRPDFMYVRDDKFKYGIFLDKTGEKYITVHKVFEDATLVSFYKQHVGVRMTITAADESKRSANLPDDLNDIFDIFKQLRKNITEELNL